MHTLTGNDAATLTLNDRQQAYRTLVPGSVILLSNWP